MSEESQIRQMARDLTPEEVRRGLNPQTLADCHLRTLVFSLMKPDALVLPRKKKKED